MKSGGVQQVNGLTNVVAQGVILLEDVTGWLDNCSVTAGQS